MSGDSEHLLEIARNILREGAICDHCLGRQFAKLSTGLTDRERGWAIRLVLAMIADMEDDQSLRSDVEESGRCWVCNGIFEELDSRVSRALDVLNGYEYETFLVGTRLSGLLSENEELLWEIIGTDYAEPLKSEINREAGKRIADVTHREVDFTKPDVVVMLDLASDTVQPQVRSIYICGRYQKLVRGIPQTRLFCPECKGEGCEQCGFTGKTCTESVDELVAAPVIEATNADDTTFHGAGREDIDARMLGDGRPFVVEVKNPHKRKIDIARLERDINEYCEKKVVVSDLRFVDHGMVKELKSQRYDKLYRVTISCAGVDHDTLVQALDGITGVIRQRTPLRVVHRRADLVRERRVCSALLESFSGDSAVIRIGCEAGLYVKELISGDDGRTVPSLSAAVGADLAVTELDVLGMRTRS